MQLSEPSSRRPRLRAAHVTQIPMRTGDLCQRGKRLCESGWDINAALLLAEDAEALASTCHQLGELATASRLEHFAESLWPLLDPPIVPDPQVLQELMTRFEALETGSVEGSDTPLLNEHPSGLFGYAASEENGFPLLTRPPSRYWQRFASLPLPERIGPDYVEVVTAPVSIEIDEIETPALDIKLSRVDIESEAGNEAVAATLAEAIDAEPETVELEDPDFASGPAENASNGVPEDLARIACHLHDGSDMAAAIDLQLGMLGYALKHVEGIDELKAWLSRSTPALVMLDGDYQYCIEEIGALVQAARSRSNQRILLIAHGTGKSDLAARLRAMRAGCDACIVQPESAEVVLDRVRELDLAAQAEPFRIMIVEDDRSQAFFAESILRKNGMLTLAIGEASAVLDRLDEFDPDLILMDLNMPVCNGIELTALIREREAYISTPIVFLSGEGDTEKHFEALSAGGDDFLSKPIAPRHLISAVTSRVRRARQLARHRAPAPATRDVLKRGHTPAEISARLTELLAMEDAATRSGGILYIAIESAGDLRRQLGARDFASLTGEVAALIESQLGKNDMFARNGDSDFLLLNPDRSGAALDQFAAQLCKAVADQMSGQAGSGPDARIAVGVCAFSAAVGDARAMIETAEQALMDAPQIPETPVKATVVSIAPRPDIAADPMAELIRKALRDGSFRVVFQPIVSLHGEEEKQFQALLRLSTEEGRVYSATELIPAAEKAQLIGEVDRWMFESCLETIAEHLRSGDNVRLFVNQSARSVLDPDRINWIRQALESRRIPAAQISIDLRMEDASANLAAYMGFALAMKKLGVGLTLSGVEGGDRTTDMLMHMPVDSIKLSPRYTSDNGGDHRSELRDLVHLAHASGRKVIAPRVEEARVAASLWACGIDLIQGNFVQQATRDATYDFKVAHA